jgi:hypothetical protein
MRLKRHIDFINENDNLKRSVKGMGKFGLLPKEEIIQRVKDLLGEHVFDPQNVSINHEGDLQIDFWPGSSLKRDIKSALKGDDLINTYFKLSPIEFINWGGTHSYSLRPIHVDTGEEDTKATPEEIANDMIANCDFREEDLYGEEILSSELDKYLPDCSYDVEESDYDEIVRIVINKIGIEENEED